MKFFIKDMKKYGLVYAFLIELYYLLNYLFSRRITAKILDWVEEKTDKYDKHLQPQEIIEFKSNCINYWSCDCCPNRGCCNEY